MPALAPPILHKLDTLPTGPGVYLFHGPPGQVLYIGKAHNLRSRVRSYFQAQSNDTRAFIARLTGELRDIETVVVGNDTEAALLESELIKQHKPRYNVKLRDDKQFLSLRLDPRAAWPRLEVVRRAPADGAHYFGPYPSASAARRTLHLVGRRFQLRTCSDSEMRARTRPCLQYQIKRCPAPCVFDVDRESYGEQVERVRLFLAGRHAELSATLEARMRQAAAEMHFEQAALCRDQLRALQQVQERQRVVSGNRHNQDVFGLLRDGDTVHIALVRVRAGRVLEVQRLHFDRVRIPDDALLADLLRDLYGPGHDVPDEILLPLPVELSDAIAAVLTPAGRKKTRIHVPQRGDKAALLRLASQNAAHAAAQRSVQQQDASSHLTDIQRALRLPRLPQRIECVDISHTGGEDPVAVFAVLQDGKVDTRRYRSFALREARGGDDYGAMHEVLLRRLERGRQAQVGWELPDLLLVDGGRGQLAVAEQALKALGMVDVPLAALAKEKLRPGDKRVVDRVFVPGQKNPVRLRDGGPGLRLLALVRDEAHRASNL
ncbi:MAG: excinuclease ABC subunit UvrC, partial [Polyangiales bacterium]